MGAGLGTKQVVLKDPRRPEVIRVLASALPKKCEVTCMLEHLEKAWLVILEPLQSLFAESVVESKPYSTEGKVLCCRSFTIMIL